MKGLPQDERIIQEARKQNSLAFSILYYGTLLVLLYRQFIIRETVSEYWDIALLFFGVTFYLAFKRVSSGILTVKPNLIRIIPWSIAAAVAFSIVNYWFIGNTSPAEILLDWRNRIRVVFRNARTQSLQGFRIAFRYLFPESLLPEMHLVP